MIKGDLDTALLIPAKVVHEAQKVWLHPYKNTQNILHSSHIVGGVWTLETSTGQAANFRFSPPLTLMPKNVFVCAVLLDFPNVIRPNSDS